MVWAPPYKILPVLSTTMIPYAEISSKKKLLQCGTPVIAVRWVGMADPKLPKIQAAFDACYVVTALGTHFFKKHKQGEGSKSSRDWTDDYKLYAERTTTKVERFKGWIHPKILRIAALVIGTLLVNAKEMMPDFDLEFEVDRHYLCEVGHARYASWRRWECKTVRLGYIWLC